MTLFNKKMNFFEHGKKIQSFFYNFLNVEHKFSKFVSSRLILRNLQFNWQKELFLRIFVYIIITNLFGGLRIPIMLNFDCNEIFSAYHHIL